MGTASLNWLSRCATVASTAIILLVVSFLLPVDATSPTSSPVTTVRVTDRTGNSMRLLGSDGRSLPIRLDAVAPLAIKALIATEDRNFRNHSGIDVGALVAAAIENARARRVVRGGSTLTMQVARSLRGRQGRTIWNKLAEMHLALRLESHLTKDEILTLWLNRVEFGNALVGIEAASEYYFGKSAIDLTDAEATFLVGLPQSPTRYNPLKHLAAAQDRHRRVLDAAVATGALSEDARLAILATPPQPSAHRWHFRAPHLVERIALEYSRELPRLTEIRTTINPWVQDRVERLALTHASTVRQHGVSGIAAVVLDNASGNVIAYLGSADFFDEPSLGQNDGVTMLRQPGSALKPFVYATALATGRYSTSSILPDLPVQIVEAGAAFSPANYDQKFHGPVPLRVALASSYNVPAIRVTQDLGPYEVLQTLRDVGFASLDRPAEHYGVGLALGNGEVQLIELARAYAALSRGGVFRPSRHVEWVRTRAGDTLSTAPRPDRQTVVTPQVAYLISDILSDPEARAPAFGRGGPLELPFPVSVKTGTSKDYRDNYAVGYTSEHTVAVWAGNFDGSPMKQVSGVSGAAPLLKSIFLELGAGERLERPAGVESVVICPISGDRPGAYCPTRVTRPFLRGTAPADTCTVHRGAYTVYDSRYHEWMRSNGIPFPPTEQLTLADADNEVTVAYPSDGTTWIVDPVLRPEYQRVRFRAITPAGSSATRWVVDDDTLRSDLWTISEGRHEVVAVVTGAGGRKLKSQPHTVNVIGPPTENPPGDR